MTGRSLRKGIGRRALIQAAALGIGGLALACRGGGAKEPPITRGGAVAPSGPGAATARAERPATTIATAPPPASLANAQPQCLVTKQVGLPPGYVPSDLAPLPARLLASDGVRMRAP